MTSRNLRLAVSNIAWDPAEDDAVADVLRREGATGVEIAPTKWRSDPLSASAQDVAAYRRAWEDRGLQIVSLQSLLFGLPALQLFDGAAARTRTMDVLRGMIDLAGGLGAQALVFGSPKNRVRGALPLADATAIAVDFFREIGAHAYAHGVAMCIEANPAGYGCDFVTTTDEATDLCRLIDHPGVRINGDLGGMTMSHEDPRAAIETAGACLAHFHASEPNLAPFGEASDHSCAAKALETIHYSAWVSIEMRAAGSGENAAAIEKAVRLARNAYT